MRILLHIILIFGLLSYVLCIAVNISGVFTFRKSDERILVTLDSLKGYHTDISVMHAGEWEVSYAHVTKDSARPAVIFVHGSPGALDAYLPFLYNEQLATSADLYSYDRPGFGNTRPCRPETSLKGQAEVLKELIESIGAPKTILVGHSQGCPVILRLAMEYPHLCDGQVLIAAPVSPELEPANWWRYFFEYPPFNMALPRPFAHSNSEILPLKCELRKLESMWDQVQCPMVLIHGSEDRLVPLGNVAYAQKMLPDSTEMDIHVIEGEGHFILWTHIDRITREIVDLL